MLQINEKSFTLRKSTFNKLNSFDRGFKELPLIAGCSSKETIRRARVLMLKCHVLQLASVYCMVHMLLRNDLQVKMEGQ